MPFRALTVAELSTPVILAHLVDIFAMSQKKFCVLIFLMNQLKVSAVINS